MAEATGRTGAPRKPTKRQLARGYEADAPFGYVFCLGSGTVHEIPVALPIKVGKKGCFFVRCICGSNAFLSRNWEPHYGWTRAECEEQGALICK